LIAAALRGQRARLRRLAVEQRLDVSHVPHGGAPGRVVRFQRFADGAEAERDAQRVLVWSVTSETAERVPDLPPTHPRQELGSKVWLGRPDGPHGIGHVAYPRPVPTFARKGYFDVNRVVGGDRGVQFLVRSLRETADASRARLAPMMLLGGLALAACDGSGAGSGQPAAIPDLLTVERTSAPHDALVCPERACAAEPDRVAPIYPASPDALLAAWRAAIEAEPRTEIVAVDPGRHLLLARQRSRVFGFVDTVAVRALPVGDGASSFAARSVSETGWYDFGANAARLEAWQAAAEVLLRQQR
jgi:uncharacterized protein (DUF1499 family)